MLDSIHDGFIAVDGEGTVTLFNRAAERITGMSAESVLGLPAVEAIPNTRLHAVLRSGEPELNRQQRVGETVIVTNRMPVRDSEGRVVGAVAVFRDVTELEALSREVSNLWQARELLEAVIETMYDAVSVADEKGNNIIVNGAYTRITGLPKDAVLGKPATVDIAEGESMHMKVLRSGKPVRNVRIKVGPMKKEVIVNVVPIFIDGRIRGSVGVIHDITEIISLTEELTRTKELLRHLRARYSWDDIIGESAVLEAAKEQARRAAETKASVLLLGESGTGKELFAHAIHNASERSGSRFLSINCAALTESLLESELFGYVGGAFTGALKGGKKGIFEEADGGTVFLDEIGEVSQNLQSKLLRVLQEKEIVRVGGAKAMRVDVRVIAATNADLEDRVNRGEFRKDLYYRLSVIPITILPLRERREDIRPLAEHLICRLNQEFGRHIEGISDGALAVLREHDWPGNVRELENALGRAIINMHPRETVIAPGHLPPLGAAARAVAGARGDGSAAGTLGEAVAEAEKKAVLGALENAGGDRTKAAAALGISVRSIYYKIKRYGIK